MVQDASGPVHNTASEPPEAALGPGTVLADTVDRHSSADNEHSNVVGVGEMEADAEPSAPLRATVVRQHVMLEMESLARLLASKLS